MEPTNNWYPNLLRRCPGDLIESWSINRMGVKRGNLTSVIFWGLLVFLTGCALHEVGSDQSAVAALPPAPEPPVVITLTADSQSPDGEPTVPVGLVSEMEKIPTAIARVIDKAFPTTEPTLEPTASPTPMPEPLPTPVPCTDPGRIVTGTFPSESAGFNPYRIYLPPCYGDDSHVYPTLYMLPGNIHSDGIWDVLGLDEEAEAAIKRGEIPPLLIVMTSGGNLLNYTSGGPYSYESLILEDLLPYIESNYCAWRNPAGRAIGGISRGGYWSLEIAFRHPDQFASVGGHSASLYDYYGGPEVQPNTTGLSNDLGDLRIYFDIGEYDPLIPNIRKLHEDMDEAGIEHVWRLNEGRHDDAYWSSHTREYITWYSEPWSLQREDYPLCDLKSDELSR